MLAPKKTHDSFFQVFFEISQYEKAKRQLLQALTSNQRVSTPLSTHLSTPGVSEQDTESIFSPTVPAPRQARQKAARAVQKQDQRKRGKRKGRAAALK